MHPSAMEFGGLFFKTYCKDRVPLRILDIGAQDVNGSLKTVSPAGTEYIGVDFVEGKGVDVILKDPYILPFEDNSVDAIVCSSVFEHSEFFWLLFLEVLRILKPSGLLYLNVPSNGYIHRYPVDCWRFYPDAGRALVSWAERSGYAPALLESFIGEKNYHTIEGDAWNDFVAVFVKQADCRSQYPARMLHSLESYGNAYCDDPAVAERSSQLPHDFKLIQQNNQTIVDLDHEVARLREEMGHLHGGIAALKESNATLTSTVVEQDAQLIELRFACQALEQTEAAQIKLLDERQLLLDERQLLLDERQLLLEARQRVIDECQRQLADRCQENADLNHERAALRYESAPLRLQHGALTRENDALKQANSALVQERDVLLLQRDALSRETVTLSDALARSRNDVELIYASNSWRYTAPLRAVKTRLGR